MSSPRSSVRNAQSVDSNCDSPVDHNVEWDTDDEAEVEFFQVLDHNRFKLHTNLSPSFPVKGGDRGRDASIIKLIDFIYAMEMVKRTTYEIAKSLAPAERERGYIHNLLIENRSPLLPIPPKTTHEALSVTRTWWPSWDKRTQRNCLLTCNASAPLTDRIREIVETWDGETPECYWKYVIERCKKWNLVWVGEYKAAVLESDEMCPVVLPSLHPPLMRRLGIPLNNVVAVEIPPVNRKILHDWWRQTNQNSRIILVDDIQSADDSMIDGWIKDLNGFDLVIGRSPSYDIARGTEERAMALRAGTPFPFSITIEY
ncbi:hypothetical protein Cgig2_003191 [Carnegiea gigantea]|uniref:SAM-dependent MTase DRM-type domain-containing protein n=1 Tax=Carnegiea gigantea TaxID=171969 RepID=A0A9Q1JNH3_9CARY|nr:hypothetical protein Cgig2_003191 [Carnegiea gigantea]